MTRFLFRLISILLLSVGMVTLITLGLGRLLAEEDEMVFSTFQGYGIYHMALGRGVTAPLMNSKSRVIQPDWSPDGKHIAFVDNGSAQLALYITDAEGGNKNLLTNNPFESDYDPKWSPDGRYIAYSTSTTHARQAPVIQLTLFDTRTQTKRALITTQIFREHMLYWSPDSTQITFVRYSQKRANSDIFSINVNTGAIHTLISTPDNDEYPIWSPDGRFIGFVSGSSQRGIYVLDTTTGQITLLYTLSGVSYPSDWSHDSRFIFFSSVYNVYQLNVADCLSKPKTCTPQLLIKGGGDARRKPRQP